MSEAPKHGVNPDLAAMGCCGQGCKEDCTSPPCPCNMECWTPLERRDLEAKRRLGLKGRAT